MSSLQFPPSSPVLDGPESEPYGDPFKGKELPRGRFEYPTPNPSSTLGRSSSPASHEKEIEPLFSTNATVGLPIPAKNDHTIESVSAHEHRRKNFESSPYRAEQNCGGSSGVKDFNIVSPRESVLRVPLLADKSSVTIGRSSKSCDYHFKSLGSSLDKTISRVHVKVDYVADKLVLTCMGFNGMGVIVPSTCLVKKLGDKTFELHEAKTPLPSQDVSRSIRTDHQHTEFNILRGESVHMPRFSNILLQIGIHTLLVNPDDVDDEATDDESLEALDDSAQICENKLADKPSVAPKSTVTPVLAKVSQPQTPKKVSRIFLLEESTPSKPQKSLPEGPVGGKDTVPLVPHVPYLSQVPRENAPTKRPMTPLASRSVNLPDPAVIKRRAQSEEPQGSAKKMKKPVQEHDANGKLIIVERVIEGISNIAEIENILVNHLAFSRLSSTPASFLNTISAVVAKLTLQQLRVVLHKTNCIGVIYRQGKDAAGKPLEEEYYYIPEKDRDPERNKLVSSVRGHGGLRACRKTHKQYYWKKPAPIKK